MQSRFGLWGIQKKNQKCKQKYKFLYCFFFLFGLNGFNDLMERLKKKEEKN